MKRRISVALIAVLAAVGSSIIVAGPAVAAPTGCSAGGGAIYATAYCSGGTGSYQAWAQCQGTIWPYYYSFVESDWKSAGSGQTAIVFCRAWDGSVVVSRGYSRRN
jgi:hypothetical protein